MLFRAELIASHCLILFSNQTKSFNFSYEHSKWFPFWGVTNYQFCPYCLIMTITQLWVHVQNCCTTCSFIFLSWPIDTDTQEKIGRRANRDHILYYVCILHFEFWRLVIVIIWILQIIPGEISRIEIRWQNYFCLLYVFPFFPFLVTQLILRYIETGLLSRTIFLCPSGIMRYNRCYASLIFCHIYARFPSFDP